ncbi:MAG: SGNH/GDSL hydrolase family protein [Micromonosporaceae bacterium]
MNARRIARRAAKGAVIAFIAGTVGGAALLAAEAVAARSRRYARPDLGLAMRATLGKADAAPLRIVLLGDASALGVGVETVGDTVGGRLAELLADAGVRVALSSVAVSGARSGDLATQVARAQLGERADVAVILVGTQDAIRVVRPSEAATALATAVRRLRDSGTAVVVGTCPDLAAVRAIAPPLRQVVGWLGRRVARAQAAAARAAGASVVDLAAQVGPVFRADPGMLCRDAFHPSADGYRVMAYALFPAVAEACPVDLGQPGLG